MDRVSVAVVQEHGVVSKHLLRDITIQWKRTSLTVTCTSLGCYPCFVVFYIPIKTIFFNFIRDAPAGTRFSAVHTPV
jgi:hypothetical protein